MTKWIGAHVSISGGVENAPLHAADIHATAFAMFTKNQRQWTAPALTPESIAAFKKNCTEHGFSPEQVLPHDGYLINLGNPDPEKRKNAVAAFTDEMLRCQQLGLKLLNFHPGSHLKQVSAEECIQFIAQGVNSALRETQGVTAVFENTAGQGSNLGFTFGQLAQMLELIEDPSRAGICLDTCHLYASGYDIRERYDEVMDEFGRVIGFDRLKGMHLNDSKSVLGGKLDRHNSLGKGELGLETFRKIMRDPRTDNMPLVLETIDEALWPQEIELLQAFAKD